jgi:cytochrome c-type biogenesis protein CcmH/NrfG
MWILYSTLISLLISALCLLLWPFTKNRRIKIIISLFAGILCFGLYFLIGRPSDLKEWLTQGKQHYALVETYQALGGIDGMIERIKEKLKKNPSDQTGWVILGKLYLAQHNEKAAKEAFKHAGL